MPTKTESTSKTERLEARIPGDLKAVLLQAAALEGVSLTDFVVSSATERARRVIHDSEVLELSKRDQRAFALALLNPPKASAKLKSAAKRYMRERG